MALIFLDFEATCIRNGRPEPQEIIEFPSVVLDGAELVDRIQLYVRPTSHPTLSDFCTELTGIRQATVDAAQPFPEVLARYDEWAAKYPDATVVTCGDWDLKSMLPLQCWSLWIKVPERYRRWINIKDEFESFYRRRAGGLQGMLSAVGLEFEGRPHSGIDDCVNTARVWRQMCRNGYDPTTATVKWAPRQGGGQGGGRSGNGVGSKGVGGKAGGQGGRGHKGKGFWHNDSDFPPLK
jgi:inhibitor of KinA sporulation pathway (predicted exonuclease)